MCVICDGKYNQNMIFLDCQGCQRITSIPQLDQLTQLDCWKCPLLTKIPQLNKLTILYCSNCPLLTTLPQLKKLKKLCCSYCPLLNTLPQLNQLTELNCHECPLLYMPYKLRQKFRIKPNYMINKIRHQQLRIRRKYRNMIASTILDNTPFYDVLIEIIFNYTNTGFPRI